jgi:parallel beta-helix repeat protein
MTKRFSRINPHGGRAVAIGAVALFLSQESLAYVMPAAANDGDSTAELQAALSTNDTVEIPNTGSAWFSGPLTLKSNQRLILHADARLEAIDSELHYGSYSETRPGPLTLKNLINIRNANNVIVESLGFGASRGTIAMRGDLYRQSVLFRRDCIHIQGSTNVVVRNLQLTDGGGNGVWIEHFGNEFLWSNEIEIYNCRIAHCNWAGVVVTNGRSVNIHDNTIEGNTNAGIYFEPSNTKQIIQNNYIHRNTITKSQTGLKLVGSAIPRNTGYIWGFDSFRNLISDCRVGFRLEYIYKGNSGLIKISDSQFRGCSHNFMYFIQPETGGDVSVKYEVSRNDFANGTTTDAILIAGMAAGTVGGVSFGTENTFHDFTGTSSLLNIKGYHSNYQAINVSGALKYRPPAPNNILKKDSAPSVTVTVDAYD